MDVFELPIDQIRYQQNVRTVVEDEALRQLAHSMDVNGQLVPVHIYYDIDADAWVLRFGHRRVAAATLLGWTTIKAIVVNRNDDDEGTTIVQQYAENEERVGLTYLEKARVYQSLLTAGWHQARIADACNVSPTYVSLALATLRADPRLQAAVEQGKISPSAIEPLLSKDRETQARLADAAIQAKTARAVTALVKADEQQHSPVQMALPEHSVPLDADPLESVYLVEIEEYQRRMASLLEMEIRHPELRRRARLSVNQLVEQALRLKEKLDQA